MDNDSYAAINSKNFVSDMSPCPQVELHGAYLCYFIDRPGVYTCQKLLQWKQLNAYNFFTSVLVQTVGIWDLNYASQCVILKALVNQCKHA